MNLNRLIALLNRLPGPLIRWLDRRLRRIPAVNRRIEAEIDAMLAGVEDDLHPYRAELPTYAALPPTGRSRAAILAEMAELQAREADRWRDGLVSGAVYHGDDEHIAFLNQVYALHSQTNPLHADLWPSVTKYEAEIVSMTATMLGGGAHGVPTVCGTVTSGGTESILLAMKTYRDWARVEKGIRRPELVVPQTAHAAFDKAAAYFKIKLVRVPVDDAGRVQVDAVRRAIGRRTIALVGSAPAFPHGGIDPIAELSALALEHKVGLHVDACLGGFVLPWARRLGVTMPAFDFSLPGVTSMSADTHKFGYAAKGTSVVLYRTPELRRYQYYAIADWPGGLYLSPTLAGSRSGALSAMAWAALLSIGEAGYLDATRRILSAAETVKAGVRAAPDLRLIGDPLFVVAFASDTVDIYQVLDRMTARGWSLNGLHHPPALHLCVTLRHTQPGVAERFVDDLHAAVAAVADAGGVPATEGMAPVYGMAASMPLKGVVTDVLKRYLDLLYRV